MEATILKRHQLRCPYCKMQEAGHRKFREWKDGGGIVYRYHNFLLEQTSPKNGYDIYECLVCKERFYVID